MNTTFKALCLLLLGFITTKLQVQELNRPQKVSVELDGGRLNKI